MLSVTLRRFFPAVRRGNHGETLQRSHLAVDESGDVFALLVERSYEPGGSADHSAVCHAYRSGEYSVLVVPDFVKNPRAESEQLRENEFLLIIMEFAQLNYANAFAALRPQPQQVQFPPQIRRDGSFDYAYSVEAYIQVAGLLLELRQELPLILQQVACSVWVPPVEGLPAGETGFSEVLEAFQFPGLLGPDPPRATDLPLPGVEVREVLAYGKEAARK